MNFLLSACRALELNEGTLVVYRLAEVTSPRTQAFLLVGTLFLLPVILTYSAWSYWAFLRPRQ